MKQFIIILIFIFSVSTQVDAQKPPGYQGKRMFLEAGVSTMVWSGPTIKDEDIGLNTRWKLDLSWVLGRKHSLRIGYGHLASGVYDYAKYPKYSKTNNYRERDGYIHYEIYTNSISLSLDFYKKRGKGMLAPLGSYLSPSLMVLFTQGVLPKDSPYAPYVEPHYKKIKGMDIALGGQWGYRTVFFNRMIFSIALECYIVLPFSPNYEISNRLRANYLLNLHLGIGMLLF